MITNASGFNLKRLKNYADWYLLSFLLLFLNVKLAVKIPAIILIYLLQFNFKFGFSFKNSRLPLFYPLIIIIGLIDYLIIGGYTNTNYTVMALTGISFWVACILAIHQVKLAVEQNDTDVIHRTIVLFFIINTVISLLNLAAIIWETGAINPYTYQGQYQKYFIGTGDYIKGITFDTSTTNAVLNAFGVIYFLTKKNAVMLLTCMAILLLTGSNFINIILFFILLWLFVFNSSKDQKSLLVVCMIFLVVFMAKISPQNNNYVATTIKNTIHQNKIFKQKPIPPIKSITETPDSLLNTEERKQKIAMLYIDNVYRYRATRNRKKTTIAIKNALITDAGRIYIAQPDINSAPYQSLKTTPPQQSRLLEFVHTHKALLPVSGNEFHMSVLPGKVISMLQTINFFKQHPQKVITGDGMGNFSSKLAFKASGLGLSGSYPLKYRYINHDFLVNHLDLYLNFFSRGPGLHSLTNSPFSVYDQLFAEYGIIGLLLFLIYYLGSFFKNRRLLTYGLPILLLTTVVLFIDYWFEQLSVLVFFELLILLNIKESSVKNKLDHGH
jgi:hypothetical protein